MWDKKMSGNAHPRDQVMLLAYNVASKDAFYTTTGQFRDAGEDILEVDGRKGKAYHIYFAFTASDRSRQSNSVYFGGSEVLIGLLSKFTRFSEL